MWAVYSEGREYKTHNGTATEWKIHQRLRDAIISEARRKLKFMENTSHAAVSEMRYE